MKPILFMHHDDALFGFHVPLLASICVGIREMPTCQDKKKLFLP